jgi:molybdopterin-guanine dinucleotide biosynthesis protein A
MPRLVPAVLERLVSELVDRPSIAALTLVAERPSPLPMAIRPGPAVIAVRETLAAGRRSLLALLDRLPAATLAAAAWRPLDPGGLTLSDVDRPSDLPAADG